MIIAPALSSPMTIKLQVDTPSGAINTVLFQREPASGKPVMLLLHGWGGGLAWWAPMIDILSDRPVVRLCWPIVRLRVWPQV
jgi:pimeloyl-ACP methyl ester carboxylesterase